MAERINIAPPWRPDSKDEIRISTLDLAVLLDHLSRGAYLQDVGYENTEVSYKKMLHRLGTRLIRIRVADVESALWSCNLMNEVGKFQHPQGYTLETFVSKMLKEKEFNYIYNYVEEKKK